MSGVDEEVGGYDRGSQGCGTAMMDNSIWVDL